MGLGFEKLKREIKRVAKQVGNEADRFLGLVHDEATRFGDKLEGLNNEATDGRVPVAAAAEAAPAVVFAPEVVAVAAQREKPEEQKPNKSPKITLHLV
jgi:hypothetical protein